MTTLKRVKDLEKEVRVRGGFLVTNKPNVRPKKATRLNQSFGPRGMSVLPSQGIGKFGPNLWDKG
jgi:hypothetical protein